MDYIDLILSRLMTESIVRNGNVSLEEAQFFNVLTKDVLRKVYEIAEAEAMAEVASINEFTPIDELDELDETTVISETANIARKLLR